jgi:hypothetical protein
VPTGACRALFNLTENRTERVGMAMSNEPTVIELTFEGDDRVFYRHRRSHNGRGRSGSRLPTSSRTKVLAFRCGSTPLPTMAMFEGGASKDQVLAHLESRPNALMPSKHSSRLSNVSKSKINGVPRGRPGLSSACWRCLTNGGVAYAVPTAVNGGSELLIFV